MTTLLAAPGLCLLAALAAPAAAMDDSRSAPVGMSASIDELVLPGSLLEPRPADARTPLILRIAHVSPHGTAFRYDLAWVGLEPGRFDLRDYLRRVDGSSTEELPPLPVDVTSLLPAGNARPTVPPLRTISGLGGYRILIVAACVLWIAGLVALVMKARRSEPAATGGAAAHEVTFEERLRGLIEQASRAPLTPRQRAELELTLVQHWRRKLDLGGLAPAAAFQKLKAHPESAACIERLEEWLHKPQGPGSKEAIDVRALWNP